jgi:hypothetical protein
VGHRITGWLNSHERKKAYIQAAKNRPCIDCIADGRDPHWPLEAMSLDHLGLKKMWLSDGSERRNGERVVLIYTAFTFAEVKAEVDGCEAICMNHHNIRTRRRNREKSKVQVAALDAVAPQTLFDDVPQ